MTKVELLQTENCGISNMKKIRNSCLLVLTAFIWGVAFVAQSEGSKAAGPFSFNGIRNIIAGVFLLVFILLKNMIKAGSADSQEEKYNKKYLVIGGICCGIILFVASTLQQLGIDYGAAVGKAGFLTACYIMIVPILGIFLHKKCGINVWISVFMAVVGLYLLCIKQKLYLQKYDIILLCGALFFAVHILVIDYFSPKTDGVKMACIQFFVCGILNIVPILIFDAKVFEGKFIDWLLIYRNMEVWYPILFAGVLSSGVGYTLQIVGQKGLDPTTASLILSLESVFSVLAGWILLNQNLSIREISGCVLIFAGIILAQIPMKNKKQWQ